MNTFGNPGGKEKQNICWKLQDLLEQTSQTESALIFQRNEMMHRHGPKVFAFPSKIVDHELAIPERHRKLRQMVVGGRLGGCSVLDRMHILRTLLAEVTCEGDVDAVCDGVPKTRPGHATEMPPAQVETTEVLLNFKVLFGVDLEEFLSKSDIEYALSDKSNHLSVLISSKFRKVCEEILASPAAAAFNPEWSDRIRGAIAFSKYAEDHKRKSSLEGDSNTSQEFNLHDELVDLSNDRQQLVATDVKARRTKPVSSTKKGTPKAVTKLKFYESPYPRGCNLGTPSKPPAGLRLLPEILLSSAQIAAAKTVKGLLLPDYENLGPVHATQKGLDDFIRENYCVGFSNSARLMLPWPALVIKNGSNFLALYTRNQIHVMVKILHLFKHWHGYDKNLKYTGNDPNGLKFNEVADDPEALAKAILEESDAMLKEVGAWWPDYKKKREAFEKEWPLMVRKRLDARPLRLHLGAENDLELDVVRHLPSAPSTWSQENPSIS